MTVNLSDLKAQRDINISVVTRSVTALGIGGLAAYLLPLTLAVLLVAVAAAIALIIDLRAEMRSLRARFATYAAPAAMGAGVALGMPLAPKDMPAQSAAQPPLQRQPSTGRSPDLRDLLRQPRPTSSIVILSSSHRNATAEIRDLNGDLLFKQTFSTCPRNIQLYYICKTEIDFGFYEAIFTHDGNSTKQQLIAPLAPASDPLVLVHDQTKALFTDNSHRHSIKDAPRAGKSPCLEIHLNIPNAYPILTDFHDNEVPTTVIVEESTFYFDDLTPGGYTVVFSEAPGYTPPPFMLLNLDGIGRTRFGVTEDKTGELIIVPKSRCNEVMEAHYKPQEDQ